MRIPVFLWLLHINCVKETVQELSAPAEVHRHLQCDSEAFVHLARAQNTGNCGERHLRHEIETESKSVTSTVLHHVAVKTLVLMVTHLAVPANVCLCTWSHSVSLSMYI